jgi:hypothetical protein
MPKPLTGLSFQTEQQKKKKSSRLRKKKKRDSESLSPFSIILIIELGGTLALLLRIDRKGGRGREMFLRVC